MKHTLVAAAICLPTLAFASERQQYQQALDQARAGQTEPALRQLEQLIAEHPIRKQYRYDYLQVLLWANRNEDVLKTAEPLDVNAAPPYVLEAIAKAARNLGQLQRAEQLYRLASDKAPQRLQAQLGLAWVMLDQHQSEAASNLLDNLAQRHPDEVEIRLALGQAREQAGLTQQAIDIYQGILSRDPKQADALRALVRLQGDSGDYINALASVEKHRALIGDPQWAEINWNHAAWLIRQGEERLSRDAADFALIDQAIARIGANIDALPDLTIKDRQAWLIRAEADMLQAMHARKRYDDLLDRYQRLRQQGVTLPRRSEQLVAQVYLEQGRANNARDLLSNRSAEQSPEFDDLALLIRAGIDSGQRAELDSLFQQLSQLVQAHPENTHYRNDYLQLLQWSGRNQQALDVAKQSDLTEAPPYVLEAAAKAARDRRDDKQAETWYRQAAAKDPQRLMPRLGLALLELDRHHYQAAVTQFDELAKNNPDNPEIALALAMAYEQAGSPQRASHFFQRAANGLSDNREALRGQIRTLAANHRSGQALTLANRHRHLVDDEQWASLSWEHAAQLIRQGQQTSTTDANLLNRAVTALENNLAQLDGLRLGNREIWRRRARADLLLALHAAGRDAEAVEHYRRFQATGDALPDYGHFAAAEAFLAQKQALAAAEVFRGIVDREPDNRSALSGLIRALLEQGNIEEIDPLLRQLQTKAEQHPDQAQWRYDLIQILSWLERDDEVLEQGTKLNQADAPNYILEALARAARNRRDYPQAETCYRRILQRQPDYLPAQLGLARLLLDQRQYQAALNHLQSLRQQHGDDPNFLTTLGDAYLDANQAQPAAEAYRQALTHQPDLADANRGLSFALLAGGDGDQALAIGQAHRSAFSETQWTGLLWGHAGWLIRRGEEDLARDARDYRNTDRAIAELTTNIAACDQRSASDTPDWRKRAQFDLLVALRDRRRMSDVLQLNRSLLDQGIELPIYARMAVADAYLNNLQPAAARDLYLGVIAQEPNYYNAKASLAYAYLENEQPDEAVALAERLAAEQPDRVEVLDTDGSPRTVNNPRKASSELNAALFHAYTDDLDRAQPRLEQLHRQYPDNIDIHNKLAEVDYFRGWPRRAKQEIDDARQSSAEHFGLRLTEAKVAHELRDYPREEAITRELFARYPEDSGALKQMQAWQRHNRMELKLFTNGGIASNEASGPNPFIGSDNAAVEAYLYSKPMAHNFRVFTHDGWRTGLFKEGRGYLRHYGAGLEYAEGDILANAEVHYDSFRSEAIGVDLGLDYQLDDNWQLFTRLSSRDINIPLRALNSGVTAKSARIGANYRVNESRQFSLSSGYHRFSDQNDRFSLDGAYFERWYSGPFYKFSTIINAGYSSNSSQRGAYYNPKQDALVSLTLDNDLLTYRHYETAFHQRLALTVGNYWQQHYDSNAVGSIQYEHRWRINNNAEINYGGVRSYRFYDGDLTEGWQLYLNANARF